MPSYSMPSYSIFRSIASFCLTRLKTSQSISCYPVFAFVCLRFNSSGNFCDGGAICRRVVLSR